MANGAEVNNQYYASQVKWRTDIKGIFLIERELLFLYSSWSDKVTLMNLNTEHIYCILYSLLNFNVLHFGLK